MDLTVHARMNMKSNSHARPKEVEPGRAIKATSAISIATSILYHHTVLSFGVASSPRASLSSSLTQLSQTIFSQSERLISVESISAIPVFDGVIELISNGTTSSLQESNESVLKEFVIDPYVDATKLKVLVDPQTSGGLLASVPGDAAPDCLRKLQDAGYSASIVGHVADSAERAVDP